MVKWWHHQTMMSYVYIMSFLKQPLKKLYKETLKNTACKSTIKIVEARKEREMKIEESIKQKWNCRLQS